MLSKAEWVQMTGKENQGHHNICRTVTLEVHKVFWGNIEKSNYEKVRIYEVDEKPFIKYALNQIGGLFINGGLIKRSNIYKVLDGNIREMDFPESFAKQSYCRHHKMA